MTADWMVGTGLDTDMSGDPRGSTGAQTNRFWMPQGDEKIIVFITEANSFVTVWEHQVKLGGDWKNWFTCLDTGRKEGEESKCDLCKFSQANKGRFRRSKVMYGTVIDCSKWTDKDGNEHNFTRRLFGMKSDTQEIIKRRYLERVENGEGMKYAMFKVFRSKQKKSASVGTEFNFMKMADPANIPEDLREEMNYQEILQPNPEAVEAAVKQLTAQGDYSSEGGGDTGGGENIPF